jgi:hypothetical protein
LQSRSWFVSKIWFRLIDFVRPFVSLNGSEFSVEIQDYFNLQCSLLELHMIMLLLDSKQTGDVREMFASLSGCWTKFGQVEIRNHPFEFWIRWGNRNKCSWRGGDGDKPVRTTLLQLQRNLASKLFASERVHPKNWKIWSRDLSELENFRSFSICSTSGSAPSLIDSIRNSWLAKESPIKADIYDVCEIYKY